MQLEVESAGVADRLSLVVSPPQGGVGRGAVCTFNAVASVAGLEQGNDIVCSEHLMNAHTHAHEDKINNRALSGRAVSEQTPVDGVVFYLINIIGVQLRMVVENLARM